MTTTIIATAKTYNKIKIHWYIYLRGYHWSNVLCKTIVQGIAEDYIVNISQRPRHCLYCPRQSLLDCLLSCLPALEPPWLFKMLLELIIWGKGRSHGRTHRQHCTLSQNSCLEACKKYLKAFCHPWELSEVIPSAASYSKWKKRFFKVLLGIERRQSAGNFDV